MSPCNLEERRIIDVSLDYQTRRSYHNLLGNKYTHTEDTSFPSHASPKLIHRTPPTRPRHPSRIRQYRALNIISINTHHRHLLALTKTA